ncbi:DASS family sodium-coupled anion symporter [Helicobacter sp. MIT 21-1697]|uniref:SLC13 family permease n=1 Tax=Helicobacter sp. MIT 21-1697 TaxID=2993733 RepID=UPI00224B8CC6|nr:DASS family sodium-coupled anion symporter [Helicobacter sp. MIT 21-1697]MCX2716278.1 DASS family sodium-coupled anion symporter [Helicobacter sp. MIT 21-1697]
MYKNFTQAAKRKSIAYETIIGILIALAFGLIAATLARFYLEVSFKVSALLGIIALLVTLWTNKALPLGVVSLLPIILFPSFGILDTKTATQNYANPIIYLFLGGFMLATATEKIGLHRIIANKFLGLFPSTPKGIISALGLASVVLGTALSNSTTAILLLPIALSLTQDYFLKLRFLLAVAFGASISGITTPIGSPPNLIFLGFLGELGFDGISFTTWIFMMAPLTCLMLYAMIYILSRNTSEYHLEINVFADVEVTSTHKRLLFFIIALLVLLFVNSPIKPFYDGLGLNENVILLAFGLLMFVPKIGFLDWDDSKSIPYELIFLFGAGFCIATAFSQSELGGAFEGFFTQFSGLPFILFLFLACLCALIATGFLNTTALIAILLPIVYTATQSFLVDNESTITMLAVTICASFSFMIPISTPPNAIVFSQGNIKAWDMVRFGFVLSLVGLIAVPIFAFIYWRWFLG